MVQINLLKKKELLGLLNCLNS